MRAYVEIATGFIARLVAAGQEPFEPERPGHEWRDWPEGLNPENRCWPASEDAPLPDLQKQLAIAKREAGVRVKELRDRSECGGLLTPFGPIDTDADSQRKLVGAVAAAQILGATFSIDWRMADDSLVSFDAAQMIAVGLSVVTHVSSCQQRKNELDAAITNAADIAALDAIDITAGWPG
jgi:hypothetical protein